LALSRTFGTAVAERAATTTRPGFDPAALAGATTAALTYRTLRG
jgi:hypothetical protein